MCMLDFSGVAGVQRAPGYPEGEVNSVTQSSREFTKPRYLPFESPSLPGYCSLEKQINFKFFFCILDVLLTSFFCKGHVCSQQSSLTLQALSLFALIHRHLDSPVRFHLRGAGVQAAKTTASFLCTFLFSCLVFIFQTKTTWRGT